MIREGRMSSWRAVDDQRGQKQIREREADEPAQVRVATVHLGPGAKDLTVRRALSPSWGMGGRGK